MLRINPKTASTYTIVLAGSFMAVGDHDSMKSDNISDWPEGSFKAAYLSKSDRKQIAMYLLMDILSEG